MWAWTWHKCMSGVRRSSPESQLCHLHPSLPPTVPQFPLLSPDLKMGIRAPVCLQYEYKEKNEGIWVKPLFSWDLPSRQEFGARVSHKGLDPVLPLPRCAPGRQVT